MNTILIILRDKIYHNHHDIWVIEEEEKLFYGELLIFLMGEINFPQFAIFLRGYNKSFICSLTLDDVLKVREREKISTHISLPISSPFAIKED